MDIAEVLQYMKPTAEFVLLNNDLDSITWHTSGIVTPTLEEIESAHAEMIADREAKKTAKEAARQAVLSKLGLTAEEVATLLA